MDYILHFFELFWTLAVSIGLYVIIGLVFVGIVHLYVSEEWIKKHLGKKSRYSVLKGALYGIPLPLCSCGVIPLAASLRQKGASKGAVTSFFITTPMTGVDSIIATYGVFGLPIAVIRVISSLISGVAAGLLVEKTVQDEPISSSVEVVVSQESCEASSCGCHQEKLSEPSALSKALDYALKEVFADLAKPMLYGLVLATLFIMAIPQESMLYLNEYWWISYLLALMISLPMYVCSISVIPIALGLLSVGTSPGTAFIILAAAPATNIITAGIINKILGAKVLMLYLGSIVVTTLISALLIDFALPPLWFEYSVAVIHEEHGLLQQIFAVLFVVLLSYYSIKPLFDKN